MAQVGHGGSYHGSLTVIAFQNAARPGTAGRAGAPSGPPDILLPEVLPAIGSSGWQRYDRAIARTPVSGQVLIHQDLDTTVGDTYWCRPRLPSTAYNLVDIHDTAPTIDQWNHPALEIVATPQ